MVVSMFNDHIYYVAYVAYIFCGYFIKMQKDNILSFCSFRYSYYRIGLLVYRQEMSGNYFVRNF